MRTLKKQFLSADLVVVGGGLAGVCCAVTAARQGVRVVLVQDRPLLGGNASSEVRLWVLGATSHMGNNNRWAREGGVIDEILVENMWRNPEGNAVVFDSVLLEWVRKEDNLTLLLNTAVHDLDMLDESRISSVTGYCSQNQISYTISAPLFVDASGDGILGFLAGAEFRIGAEGVREHGEGLAPPEPRLDLLGHSLYFYSRDTGHPVRYIPPKFALKDIRSIPRYRELRVSDSGCRLWWLEYGGNRDTVHETEEIKWELWRVAYGVWNHIKNSGEFAGAENLALEWMGSIPGKRESRRFVGDFVLTQADIVEQYQHTDAVSFGGWAIDLHPSEGVYSAEPGCAQWHAKGVYQIPFRTMYSRNIANLFLTGRLISATHIAFASTRVMATCAHNGQAVGMAAALCKRYGVLPHNLLEENRMQELQQCLLRAGQHIPGVRALDSSNLVGSAVISASSTLKINELVPCSEYAPADIPQALLFPASIGRLPKIALLVDAVATTELTAELWGFSRQGNATPDVLLSTATERVCACSGKAEWFDFDLTFDRAAHVMLIVQPTEHVRLRVSKETVPAILTLSQKRNAAVAKTAVQKPPAGSGIDTFAFWLPQRRPDARNLAVSFSPPLDIYSPTEIANGFSRPWCGANAWVPAKEDKTPELRITWDVPQLIRRIELTLDTDFDHPMESVLMNHPETIMPGCIRAFDVLNADGIVLASVRGNHHTRQSLLLDSTITTNEIRIRIVEQGQAPGAIFEVRCYS